MRLMQEMIELFKPSLDESFDIQFKDVSIHRLFLSFLSPFFLCFFCVYIYLHIYIYIYMCVCVCVCVYL